MLSAMRGRAAMLRAGRATLIETACRLSAAPVGLAALGRKPATVLAATQRPAVEGLARRRWAVPASAAVPETAPAVPDSF
jgi:hypothetical protein